MPKRQTTVVRTITKQFFVEFEQDELEELIRNAADAPEGAIIKIDFEGAALRWNTVEETIEDLE